MYNLVVFLLWILWWLKGTSQYCLNLYRESQRVLLALALKTAFLDPGLCSTVHLLEKLGSAPGNL